MISSNRSMSRENELPKAKNAWQQWKPLDRNQNRSLRISRGKIPNYASQTASGRIQLRQTPRRSNRIYVLPFRKWLDYKTSLPNYICALSRWKRAGSQHFRKNCARRWRQLFNIPTCCWVNLGVLLTPCSVIFWKRLKLLLRASAIWFRILFKLQLSKRVPLHS